MKAHGDTTIRLSPENVGWLSEYEASLQESQLSSVSVEVILRDSEYIGDRASLDPADDRWNPGRIRTGAVMGAVQSGKTASMIGAVARSLDNGVNIVVVLAGTQVSLWKQSLGRIQRQLDSGPKPMSRRIFLPNPELVDSARRTRPSDAYCVSRGQAKQAFTRARPIVIVAMKQVDHLLHLAQTLHSVVYPAAQSAGVKARVLVVDDEADDSSIADDGVQWGSPDLETFKQIPRRIVDLWESRAHPGTTVAQNVFATYLAYTATPQANFLQDPQNPLSPRDFVATLRTPGPTGSLVPRSLSYSVPEGLDGWYTGADIYYGELAEKLCITDAPVLDSRVPDTEDDAPGLPSAVDEDAILDAVRAYLVAAAIRSMRSPGKLGPTTAAKEIFDSLTAVATTVSPVCSMLIHPSSALESHFDVAHCLRAWWHGPSGDPGSGALLDLQGRPELWEKWLASYRDSAAHVRSAYPDLGNHTEELEVPLWDETAFIIQREIIPGTSIAVINSDPDADQRPNFDPFPDEHGWRAPRNHSTIFISGNVMSRGLTLEGLLTTLFTRSSSNPLEDTQMQMQRWFGYRGKYIDLCRVFVSAAQLSLFTQYADADHALRSQVLAAMTDEGTVPDFTVLQGQSFRATGKVSGLVSRQLRPGSRPFVRHLNPAGADEENLSLVRQIFMDAESDSNLTRDRRGIVISQGLSLLDTADLLDRLRYVDHSGSPFEASRWSALARQAGLKGNDPEFPLYRPPSGVPDHIDLGSKSPYVIAAYLRFWSSCLDRRIRGVLTDDLPPQRWSLLNLDAKQRTQPRFRVGLRFGAGPPVSSGPIADLGHMLGQEVRSMARKTTDLGLDADWGSRRALDSGYIGDDLFDATVLSEEPRLRPDGTREEGSPGLVLFHLVDRSDGRGGIAVGLSIPAGGPDHMEAVSTSRRGVQNAV